MFEVTILAGKGDDVGAIIAQAIQDNPLKAGTLGVKAFEKVLRSAAGRVGSDLFKAVRKPFTKANPYGLKDLATHPSGQVIAPIVENYFIGRRGGGKMKPKRGYAPGAGFRQLMQYRMTPDKKKGEPVPPGAPDIEVGLIPERRGGSEWAKRFKDWQDGRRLPYRDRSMYAMMAALGIPITKRAELYSPPRNVIGRVEQKERPLDMFRKALYERLAR